jgi:hypothetical protein
MFSKHNDEYGDFLSHVENIIQGSQEASNVGSNSEENASWHSFIHNFWLTETCGILCIALQVIRVFCCQ